MSAFSATLARLPPRWRRYLGRALAFALVSSPSVAFAFACHTTAAAGPIQHHTSYSPVRNPAPHLAPVTSARRSESSPVRLAIRQAPASGSGTSRGTTSPAGPARGPSVAAIAVAHPAPQPFHAASLSFRPAPAFVERLRPVSRSYPRQPRPCNLVE